MKLIVDRFEGEYAVLEMEDYTLVNVPKIIVPDAVEGSIVVINVDKESTEIKQKKIKNLIDSVFID